MIDYSNRGRGAPDCPVDFSCPCEPDLHAMPKPVQAAGAKIRREIQRRYAAWQSAERSAGQYARWSARSANGARVGAYKEAAADKAKAQYDALFAAYHYWAGTSADARMYPADPALLQIVFEAPEGRIVT